MVTGLSGTLFLKNNGTDSTSLSNNGSFIFAASIADGASYTVTVYAQPAGQHCAVNNGTGTSSANVSNVSVVCLGGRYFFITATTTPGNFGDIPGADALCNADAHKPNGSTYKAFVVDGASRVACTTANCAGGTTGQVDWVLLPSSTYIRADGVTTIGTTDTNGLFPLPLTNPYLLAENASPSTQVWTGLNTDWTTSPYGTCTNWGAISGLGNYARVDISTTASILDGGTASCSANAFLACVEQ